MLGADGVMMTTDEGLRETTIESLAKLKPSFRPEEEGGKITAGNSSQITDGAAAILIMSEEKASALGLTPRARFVDFALAADDPRLMLAASIPATHKLLERSKTTIDEMDLIEINEAFASVVLAWEQELHPDMAKVNVNGGAIAIRPPARLLRRPPDDDPAQRARAHRRPLRLADDVRGRRHGQRHAPRTPRLTRSSVLSFRIDRCEAICTDRTGPSRLCAMSDVTRLVLLDHETLRRHFADLDDARASGRLSAIVAAWKPLADLLDLHAETEEVVFYPSCWPWAPTPRMRRRTPSTTTTRSATPCGTLPAVNPGRTSGGGRRAGQRGEQQAHG